MTKRLAALVVFCFLILVPIYALASDDNLDVFVSPTRNPNATEYSTKTPGELQHEQLVARSYILMERSTGEILFNSNEDQMEFPASTTKIMTALIALQFMEGDLSDTLTVSSTAVDIPSDSSKVGFKAGEVVTVQDALYGLLLISGNDAANALAEYISGDIETFVARMNDTARMLGCENTNFVNAHGYHNEYHVTTAHDLAIIMNAALEIPMFRQIISTPEYTLSPTKENPSRIIYNSNLHIRPENERYYEYSIGGKTGFTSQAGYVLVEAAEKDGVELIAVIMYSGQYSRWPDTSRLFEYGFTQYQSVTPMEAYYTNPIELEIRGFDTESEDVTLGRLTLDIKPVDSARQVRITKSVSEIDDFVTNFSNYTNIRWTVEQRAPITAGQTLGTLTFYPENEDEVVYELVATRSIKARSDAPPTLEEIERRVLEDSNPFPPFDWDWVLPPILAVLGVLLVVRILFRTAFRMRKSKKQIPKPKRRYFS